MKIFQLLVAIFSMQTHRYQQHYIAVAAKTIEIITRSKLYQSLQIIPSLNQH